MRYDDAQSLETLGGNDTAVTGFPPDLHACSRITAQSNVSRRPQRDAAAIPVLLVLTSFCVSSAQRTQQHLPPPPPSFSGTAARHDNSGLLPKRSAVNQADDIWGCETPAAGNASDVTR